MIYIELFVAHLKMYLKYRLNLILFLKLIPAPFVFLEYNIVSEYHLFRLEKIEFLKILRDQIMKMDEAERRFIYKKHLQLRLSKNIARAEMETSIIKIAINLCNERIKESTSYTSRNDDMLVYLKKDITRFELPHEFKMKKTHKQDRISQVYLFIETFFNKFIKDSVEVLREEMYNIEQIYKDYINTRFGLYMKITNTVDVIDYKEKSIDFLKIKGQNRVIQKINSTNTLFILLNIDIHRFVLYLFILKPYVREKLKLKNNSEYKEEYEKMIINEEARQVMEDFYFIDKIKETPREISQLMIQHNFNKTEILVRNHDFKALKNMIIACIMKIENSLFCKEILENIDYIITLHYQIHESITIYIKDNVCLERVALEKNTIIKTPKMMFIYRIS